MTLTTRLLNLLSRAVVTRTGEEDMQVGALAEEVLDIERPQPFGLASLPPEGAEVWLGCVGGQRSQAVALVVSDRRYLLKGLDSGEVALYNQHGAKVVLRASGDIEVTPGTGGKVVVSADVEVSGDVTAGGVSLSSHTHAAGALAAPNGAVTGTTGAPVGV